MVELLEDGWFPYHRSWLESTLISQFPLYLILVPLGTAFVIPLVDLFRVKWCKGLILVSACCSYFFALSGLIRFLPDWMNGNLFLYTPLAGWPPPFGIGLAVDGLGFLFSFLVSTICFVIILYSIGFIGQYEGKYFVLFFLFQSACQGVVLTGDLFNLYIFIELANITAYALVVSERTKESLEAGVKYMVYGILAGILLFISIILTYRSLGTLNMAQIAQHFHLIPAQVRQVIVVTSLIGLFIKLGVFPFHFWMAKVYGSSAVPVSAVLAGTLSKVNLYIFLRLFWTVFGVGNLDEFSLRPLLLVLVLASAVLGHLLAMGEKDVKRVLAFSSIAHIGFILAAFLLNSTAGLYAGLLHTVIHSLMKINLFLSTGYLVRFAQPTGSQGLDGSLFVHRGMFTCFALSCLAIIGIPPLNGFFGKWFLSVAFIGQGIHPAMFALMVGSLLAMAYYLRFVFTGVNRPSDGSTYNRKGKKFFGETLTVSIVYGMTVLIVLSGIFYRVLDQPLRSTVAGLGSSQGYISSVLQGGGDGDE